MLDIAFGHTAVGWLGRSIRGGVDALSPSPNKAKVPGGTY